VQSRLIFFPYQMPIGLFVSLIGAPNLAWTLLSAVSALETI
jgi:iron complex transport system permease protein